MSRRFNRRPLSEAERDARRQADRERIEQAARACGALALLGCGALVATMRPRLGRAALVVCASAALLIPAQR
jgi:hypothetical protein